MMNCMYDEKMMSLEGQNDVAINNKYMLYVN